jgi:thiamine pyrophosphate-dependent acetolactate synthase large subunit-like protein
MAMMTQLQALEVLARKRGEQMVVTTMSSAGIWPKLSDSPLDFHYIPSAMGHATDLGLGLALAHPKRGAIVLNGDGCMLMNLGSLVTLASQKANVVLIILDNGLYEVTGGQPIPGARQIDFANLARAAGIQQVFTFDKLEQWQTGVDEVLKGPRPAVVWLKVEGRLGQQTPKPPRPLKEQIERMQNALGVG